jgi:hypothetical protein
VHLSLLERYRRKRQLALLRRIIILLFMLILPGIFYIILMICWIIFNSIPSYSFKIITLIESLGHTGAVITIFISNSRIRRQFYHKRKILIQKKKLNKIQEENYDIISLKTPIKKQTIKQSSFTLENIVEN